MKHLKTYEQNNIKNKKYSVINILDTKGIIKKIKDLPGDKILIKLLYIYHNDKLIDQKINDEELQGYSKPKYIIENNTLFTSDDLELCIDVIKKITDIEKFNL